MDRADKTGLGVAAAGHVLLFGALSLGWMMTPPVVTPPPPPVVTPPPQPVDVSLVDKVGLEATAPQTVTPPAESKAPDLGPPEDAPVAAPAPAVEPEPVPPAPQPKPAPPPPKPAPAPPKPEPKKPVAEAKPAPAKVPPKLAAAPPTKVTKVAAKGAGAGTDARRAARGAALGDIMKGLAATPTKSQAQVPQAATMSAQAQMDIASKIVQQVQPCANRQVKPGPGAERIRVLIHLRLKRDGSLIGNPEVVGYDGTDDDNSRYLDRVKDNAIATFKGCAPLRDLPQELYDVPRGWSDFKMRYRLPG